MQADRSAGTTRSRAASAAVPGPLDEHVRDRIVAETRGNPLALLGLARGVNAAELAGGFEPAIEVSGSIDFQPRLAALPPVTRRLLPLAAADPLVRAPP